MRLLALGASDTEHFMAETHRFDVIKIGFMHMFEFYNTFFNPKRKKP